MIEPVRQSMNGVCYAPAADGQILPVIDITHAAFAVNKTEDELAAMADEFRRRQAGYNRRPLWLRRAMYWLLFRKSEFMRNLRARAGGFLDGMSTYRMKLGPAHLDPARTSSIDRKLAAMPPFLFLRMRLHTMAQFLADDLAPRLAERPQAPLHLVNIAGGPSMDSFNALLLLRQRDPGLLRNRSVQIHLFDQDEEGPAFAAGALAALKAPGAPLSGLKIELTHVPYLWDDVSVLRAALALLPGDAIMAGSSEGGLFDYGSDEAIRANLRVLHERLPSGAGVAGSLSSPNSFVGDTPVRDRVAIRIRALPPFRELVLAEKWCVARSLERVSHTIVLLKKT